MHQFVYLNDRGHSATTWDPAKPETVEKARMTFADFQGKGFAMFNASLPGMATQIREFDPAIKEIGVLRPLVGG